MSRQALGCVLLALAVAGCAATPERLAHAPQPEPMIAPEKLRDQRIEIATTTCTDPGPCKSYQVSINRDGTGDMVFYRGKRREVRQFRMSTFAFRRIQAMVEDLRPDSDEPAPAEFESTARRSCDHCPFTEVSTVHWHRDDGQVRESALSSYLPNDYRTEDLLRAQNYLMEGMLPSLLGHP